MRTIECSLLIAIALLLVARASADSDVLELSTASFGSAIKDNPLIAVEFFAPWCGHCKSLAPEWEIVATELKGKVPVAKVDCTANQELCSEQGVTGYPTLKLFRDGEASKIEVARKAKPLANFLTKELEPVVHPLSTEEQVAAFLATHPLAAVAYLPSADGEPWAAVQALAKAKRHALSFAALVRPEYAAPTLALHRDFDEPKVVHEGGEFSSAAILPWLNRHLVPLLGEVGGETFNAYHATNLPLGYVFVDPEDASTSPLLESIKPLAVQYKNDLALAWMNAVKYSQHAAKLGVAKKIPYLAIEDRAEGVRYAFPEDQPLTYENIGAWLAQYQAKQLNPYVKSEPIPSSNDEPVKVAVAYTLKDLIYDPTKDVFIEFYAPWCGHCKKLAPVWEELGILYSTVPTVVIAKMDATANDVPSKFNVRGFPTLLFFPAGAKDPPVVYQGSRSLEDLSKFILTQATHKFELPTKPAAGGEHQGHDHSHDEL